MIPELLPPTVAVKVLPHGEGLGLPAYASALAAGCDLEAAVALDEAVILPPGGRALIPTGLAMAIASGYEGQVRPRSGLAMKHGVTVLNAPGTIDADYRGEVKVLLVNLGQAPFRIERGMRIAQMIIAPVSRAKFESVTHLDMTVRAAGGFGSTGSGTRRP